MEWSFCRQIDFLLYKDAPLHILRDLSFLDAIVEETTAI